MSSSTTRVKKRDLRRAFGSEAVDLVKAQHDGLQQHAKAIELLVQVIFGRGFFGRLWWLVRGR